MKIELKRIFLFIIFVSSLTIGFAQIPKKLKTISRDFFPKNVSYLTINSEKDSLKGILILFPGLLDHPYSVFFETDLVQKSVAQGYSVVIPILSSDNDKFDLNNIAMQNLDMVIKDVMSEPINKKKPIFMGGFSIGGTRALSYLKYNLERKEGLVFKKVFAIDPPLDFVRLSNNKGREAPIIRKMMAKEFNASDLPNIDSLKKYSMFTHPDILIYPNLGKTDILIYTEPNIEWYMNQKMDLYDMNLVDIVGFVNKLKIQNPSNNINIVLTHDKGIRKQTNQKNPHSWSLLDVPVFLTWINSN